MRTRSILLRIWHYQKNNHPLIKKGVAQSRNRNLDHKNTQKKFK